MTITDLLPLEAWAELERELFEQFEVNPRVYNDKGESFTGQEHWCNPLCPALQGISQAKAEIWSAAHQFMAQDARSEGKTVISECDAGLSKVVVPVIKDGAFLGAISICGWLDPEGDIDDQLIEEVSGLSEDQIDECIDDIPESTTADLRAAIDIMKAFAAKAVA